MQSYTIKEVSQMFQLPASTLRYYEDMGILTDIARTESGQRIYLQKHINRLRTICCFKRTGMSISQLPVGIPIAIGSFEMAKNGFGKPFLGFFPSYPQLTCSKLLDIPKCG